MRASFNGDIPEIPGIAVDNFQAFDRRAYFLSHCHEDHTNCLNRISNRISSEVFIYMSEPSAAIVETNIDKHLRKFIKPLKLGSTTITIPGDDENEELHVRVTLIPAGHCFGSVMFLFETSLKKILYTGDFRITENDVSKLAALHDEDKKPIKLDVLYVDTTFQGLDYSMFPKRSDTMDYVMRDIDKWLKSSDENRVSLVPSARYGYEYVFMEIYKRLNLKVYALNNWDLYSKFLDQLVGVTNVESETKIHVCSKYWRYCPVQCSADNKNKYLVINFSAMKWRNFQPEDTAVVRDDNTMSVCFATHCSRGELVYFVEYLAAKKVVGFPEAYKPDVEMKITPAKRKTPFKSAEKTPKEALASPKKVPKSVLQKLFR